MLPETAGVPWRARIDPAQLQRRSRWWTASTLAHVLPFAGAGAALAVAAPVTLPVDLVLWAHAWIIPELYAQRGANVVRAKRRAKVQAATPERVALGLLGDLIGHDARALHAQTGLVLERGRLGVWLVGTAGALLVDRRGRRVHCWCVGVNDPSLPTGDRISHLLLALRADEQGFATVANLAFSGAAWRVRRRMDDRQRPALAAAQAAARLA